VFALTPVRVFQLSYKFRSSHLLQAMHLPLYVALRNGHVASLNHSFMRQGYDIRTKEAWESVNDFISCSFTNSLDNSDTSENLILLIRRRHLQPYIPSSSIFINNRFAISSCYPPQ
jgi:hypothetical protein